MARIEKIFVYPIKSCAGCSVKEAVITRTGLRYDRRYMVIDETGKFVSQRTKPELALLKPDLHNGSLLFRAPRMPEQVIQLCDEGAEPREASIHRMPLMVHRISPHHDEWISDYLKGHFSLVVISGAHPRIQKGMYLNCHDSSPIHVLSGQSVWDLTRRVANHLISGNPHRKEVMFDVARFRPNLYVEGNAPYEEETWRKLTYSGANGDIQFTFRKRTPRCRMIDINPDTGTYERGGHILRMLCTYHTCENKPTFGAHFLTEGEGTIRIQSTLMAS